MTISATADAGFEPPRVEVEVSVPSGNVMTAVSVWRNDSTGRSLVRSQPSAGFESRTVFDYEAPYGQAVTYDWEASYYDPADNVTTFSEPWSSFPGSWTGDTANASIASNKVTLAGSTSVSRSITRTGLSAAWDSITVASFETDSNFDSNEMLRFTMTNGSTIRLGISLSGFLDIGRFTTGVGAGVTTAIDPTSGFTISKDGSEITIANDDASYTYTASLDTIASITVYRSPQTPAVYSRVGAITAATFATVSDVAEESSAVTLNVDDAWLIAPQAPALSMPLSNTNQQHAGIRNLGPLTNDTNTTIHYILGATTPVTTTTGNRDDDTLTATIYTHTSDERAALKALLAPDLPILINIPPTWDYDFTNGYYQAGTVTQTRPYTTTGVPMRDWTIPLTKVRPPDVDVENPGWSYAQVASTWPTYSSLISNYATYADLLVDNRS